MNVKNWYYYTNHFQGYETDVRDGCHPLMFKQGGFCNSIVLVHGLTDSPLEPANPFFDSMLTALNKFSKEHHLILNS